MSSRAEYLLLAALAWLATAHPGTAAWKPGMNLPAIQASSVEGHWPDTAGKVVLLDFWASWCGPCKKSFPVLDAVSLDYRDRGLVIIGVNQDETAAEMKEFLEKNAVSFPLVRDVDHAIAQDSGIAGMPTSVLVDRAGVIRHIQTGFGRGSEEKLRLQVEALLGESP